VEVELEEIPGESDFMFCIHWPSNRQHLFLGGWDTSWLEALPSFAVAERPLRFRLPRDCIARTLTLGNAGATACIA
jgi:hypothetical protein